MVYLNIFLLKGEIGHFHSLAVINMNLHVPVYFPRVDTEELLGIFLDLL